MWDLKKKRKKKSHSVKSVFDHAIVFDVDALRHHLNESTFIEPMCADEAFILSWWHRYVFFEIF